MMNAYITWKSTNNCKNVYTLLVNVSKWLVGTNTVKTWVWSGKAKLAGHRPTQGTARKRHTELRHMSLRSVKSLPDVSYEIGHSSWHQNIHDRCSVLLIFEFNGQYDMMCFEEVCYRQWIMLFMDVCIVQKLGQLYLRLTLIYTKSKGPDMSISVLNNLTKWCTRIAPEMQSTMYWECYQKTISWTFIKDICCEFFVRACVRVSVCVLTCADPEIFFRGGPTLMSFFFFFFFFFCFVSLVDEGREDHNTTICGPSSVRQRNTI